jgi:hypothetical protein
MAKPLTRSYSGCLQENPACEYAFSFGFSYLCNHPRHKDFHPGRDSSCDLTDSNTLYLNLRESRRRTYLSGVKEFIDHLEHEAH